MIIAKLRASVKSISVKVFEIELLLHLLIFAVTIGEVSVLCPQSWAVVYP